MQPRHIIRPRTILTTPKVLAERMNCRTRRVNPVTRRKYSYFRDFLLTYPPLELMDEETYAYEPYRNLRSYASSDKRTQRRLLNLPCPKECEYEGNQPLHPLGYIVRPFRHSGGSNYRWSQTLEDFNPEAEYASEVFPKSHEYRVITVFGKIILVLRKRPPENALPHTAWNHQQGSSFQTVEASRCNLTHTSCLDDISNNRVIQLSHLTGIDVLLARDPWRYVICEVNFCPSLSIESNLTEVIRCVQTSNPLVLQ